MTPSQLHHTPCKSPWTISVRKLLIAELRHTKADLLRRDGRDREAVEELNAVANVRCLLAAFTIPPSQGTRPRMVKRAKRARASTRELPARSLARETDSLLDAPCCCWLQPVKVAAKRVAAIIANPRRRPRVPWRSSFPLGARFQTSVAFRVGFADAPPGQTRLPREAAVFSFA
jgi:hypothetical protein